MPTLHVFNPEHDYALSMGEGIYIAKKRINQLAKEYCTLPLLYAQKKDFILTSGDEILEIENFMVTRDVDKEVVLKKTDAIAPWGWDFTVRTRLETLGFQSSMMPSKEELSEIRRLSHRRISIELAKKMGFESPSNEIKDVDEAWDFYRNYPFCFFKAPWSSSGRGVVCSRNIKEPQLREWISGTISRQGSVLAERGYEKILDFASLWIVDKGKVKFRGWSVSKNSGRGKYGGNFCGSQDKLLSIIRDNASQSLDGFIQLQKEFIEEKIANQYSGRLGIDMMVCKNGEIVPCIEINLRNTMGHVAIDFYKNLNLNKADNEIKEIKEPFGIFYFI